MKPPLGARSPLTSPPSSQSQQGFFHPNHPLARFLIRYGWIFLIFIPLAIDAGITLYVFNDCSTCSEAYWFENYAVPAEERYTMVGLKVLWNIGWMFGLFLPFVYFMGKYIDKNKPEKWLRNRWILSGFAFGILFYTHIIWAWYLMRL